MKPVELRLTLGGYQAALSLQKQTPPTLPVTPPVTLDVETAPDIEAMARWSMVNLVILLGCFFFVAGTIYIALKFVFPFNLLAALYIFAIVVIMGLLHVVPHTPRESKAWFDFALIIHPRIFPLSSVAFAVLGALAALSAGNGHFNKDLRDFLNALAYLIPVIGLMVDANKSFSEASRRVFGGDKDQK